jgi:rhodanese-related sulfurtransferase
MVELVSIEEMKLISDSGTGFQIIDVREIPEYQSARIKDSKLFPLSSFDKKVNEINKTIPSYFLCGVGKRALKAAEYLESMGYKNLYVIDGGIKAWIEAGFPVECG